MDVPGPCAECGHTATLRGCPLCGAQVCADCLASGRHRCQPGGGEPLAYQG
jgi:hypothetical protein